MSTLAEAAPVDLDGSEFRLDTLRESPIVMLVFVRSDCPISNRYAPELRRIQARFAKQGLSSWLIYPDADETTSSIRRHLHEYELPFAALRDPNHDLVRATGVTVTPEAAVFAAGELVYRGRIDDLYSAPGQRREHPTTRDLEMAIEAVIAHQPIRAARTQAFGCFIPSPP